MKKGEKISDYLKPGKENAKSAKLVSAETGIYDLRALRLAIEAARKNGELILSSTSAKGGGYYLPSCEQDVDDFIKLMEARTRTSYQIMKGAKRYKKLHMGGQYYFVDLDERKIDG